MRYVVTIRKRGSDWDKGGCPATYYLSRSGFRCYGYRNVAVLRSEAEARTERDHFAKLMPEFVLEIERLPAGVRNVAKALLSAVPVPAY